MNLSGGSAAVGLLSGAFATWVTGYRPRAVDMVAAAVIWVGLGALDRVVTAWRSARGASKEGER